MSITSRNKFDGFLACPNKAAVMLDGIWRFFEGRVSRGYSRKYFTFIHNGEEITVDSEFFKSFSDHTTEEDVYDNICFLNLDNITSLAINKARQKQIEEDKQREKEEWERATEDMFSVRQQAQQNAREALESAFAEHLGRIT